jgi:hypothetical protein
MGDVPQDDQALYELNEVEKNRSKNAQENDGSKDARSLKRSLVQRG